MAESKILQINNNSGTGYCKMPDGTLIQWGIVTAALPASGEDTETIGLANSYITTPIISLLQSVIDADWCKDYVISASNVSTTGFSIRIKNKTTTAGTYTFNWITIGCWK